MAPPHKHNPGIHTAFRKLLRPVFRSLNINELLSTCSHGKTHTNNDESLNSIICKISPKDMLAVQRWTWVYHLQEYGLKECVFCTNFCISQESNRIVEMDRKLSDDAKKGHAKRFAWKRKKYSYRPGMNEVLPHM